MQTLVPPFEARLAVVGHPGPKSVWVLVVSTLGIATLAAAIVIGAAGMKTEAAGFLPYVALACFMLALAAWCWHRHGDKRLAHAAAILASGILALMLCGVISNTGLRLGAPLADPFLAQADARIGIHVNLAVRQLARFPVAIDHLTAVSNASPTVAYASIVLALVGRASARAWELTATSVLAMQVVALISIALPAIGAMSYLKLGDLQGAGLPIGAGVYHLSSFAHFRDGADPVLRLADLNGLVTFPSFHTVLALLVTQAFWDTRLRWLATFWSSMVIVSTVPIGGHYVTDLLGGFAIWGCSTYVAQRAALNSPSA
jgi:membrane-associated phospholipid phosphatase